ncbi:MAG: hypothetical protein KatS3mg024_0194 [Armatimonadota bacterium]|nr:MAG: hypothetical protein KatS3mg024_0194 [Armatimonadota bacterium]
MMEEANVEYAHIICLVNTPIARVVAPPGPKPPVVYRAAFTGFGALRLLRVRRREQVRLLPV